MGPTGAIPFDLPVAEIHHAYAAGDVRRRDTLVATARRSCAARVAWWARSGSSTVSRTRSGRHASATRRDLGAVRDCRFWTLPNLFVVDGSFMPTSGGVNPSLTITANALRVAAHIRDDFAALATNTR